jgi:tetratricopeptide (TPR) repeat protein
VSNLGGTHFDTLEAQKLLGFVYDDTYQFYEAKNVLERTIGLMSDVLGEMHPNTLVTRISLSRVYAWCGKYDEAVRSQGTVIESLGKVLGPYHRRVLLAMNNLGNIRRKQCRFQEAEQILLQVARKTSIVFLHSHGDRSLLNGLYLLAATLSDAGKLDEATNVFEEVVQMRSEVYGGDDRYTLLYRSHFGLNCVRQGNFTRAQSILEYVFETQARTLGVEHRETLLSEQRLGCTYLAQRRFHDGIAYARDALEKMSTAMGVSHPVRISCMQELLEISRRMGLLEEAEEVEREIAAARVENVDV